MRTQEDTTTDTRTHLQSPRAEGGRGGRGRGGGGGVSRSGGGGREGDSPPSPFAPPASSSYFTTGVTTGVSNFTTGDCKLVEEEEAASGQEEEVDGGDSEVEEEEVYLYRFCVCVCVCV
jgi:hypothetical protein